ncbi:MULTISPECIES: SGNH/GDSL hydrolase family protein [unclassified Streptomyces]|uniref:SGNH/GDSL hydrolase family protein n=1 Tax=unclassified Streptomyces TaxID=2593676 RepID=UPI002251229A|nr:MULTISPECIES: SGNH/GDSL hydrolase family protein [unclassified Streptomyces]MCX4885328.1 SGNH/GDSL hydrolase family protein [Streptomyces sp. NBC_00847]MCX5425192.1 SGNH/GDSL hydrolase family protein [Streptomyces sp. NBC_00078]
MADDTGSGTAVRRRRRGIAMGAALGGCALVAVSTTPAAAHGGGGGRDTRYVSLGDSYTAGPLIPTQVDANCARSDHNYPSIVAAERRVTSFKDVSCSGATTENMWKAQGTNDPQLNALHRDTDLVTVQIGGNDVGFGSIIATCAHLGPQDPAGDPCRRYYASSGIDQLAVDIARTAPKVDAVLRAVRARAPHARVLVVGYPDLLPDDGSGCYPSVPFAAGDFPYLRDTGKRLNLMLDLVAEWNRVTYVDTYGPTRGHDMCKAPADRWIEPLQPASPAAPAHPNAKGEEAMARAVLERLGKRHGRR